MEPYEIIGAPYTLWIAPTGTAYPAIDDDPDAEDWTLIGTNGNRNYDENGVTVSQKQTLNYARPAGATGPVKAFRTDEDFSLSLVLWDLTLEQYKYAMNGNPVATTAAGSGTAGFKKLGLYRGSQVREFALLLRGISAYDPAMNAQFEIPRAVDAGNPETVFTKGKPAGLQLNFMAMEDLNAASEDLRFGVLRMQHQDALA